MKEISIIYKGTGELIPYGNNPRINDEAVEYVANSIKEFGFKVPIVIDSNNIIVAGHTRLKAAESLGLERVPCIIADDLSDEQVRAFRLADNKTGELAMWDYEKLGIELQELQELNFDMMDFGFMPIDNIGWSDSAAGDANEYAESDDASIDEEGATEIDAGEFEDFNCKCPRCGFEFNM